MADIQRTIEIIFGAVDQTGSGLQSVSDGIDKTVDQISNVTGPVAGMTDSLLKAETAIIALGAAMLGFAINEAGKMNASVAEIGTLFNATGEQTDQLKAAIQEFAQDSTSSIDKINAAAYIAISTGTEWVNVTDLLAIAEKGAVAGATDLETATAALARTMNAYGLSSDDAATNTRNANDVMDALFVAVQNGDTTLDALASSLGRVASTAAAAKVPLPDLLSAIAALTTAGVSTDEAMTLMNSALKELLNPSEQLKAALGGVNLESDGLKAVMEKLQAVTGGSADKMLGLFSSTEAAKGAIILANDSAGTFGTTLEAMAARTGVVDKAYVEMAKNLDLVTQQMINSFTVASQKIGEPLLDQWVDIIKAIQAVFQGVSISVGDGAFKPVYDALNAFGAAAEKLLLDIAKNLPAALAKVNFSGLVDALQDLGVNIGSIFDGVDLSTPEGLAKAIQVVVDSVETLTRVVTGVVGIWKPVIQEMAEYVAKLNESGEGSKELLGAVGGAAQIFETFKNTITLGADALDLMATSMTVVAGALSISSLTSLGTALAGIGPAATAAAGGTGALAAALGTGGLWAAGALAAGAVGIGAGTGLAASIDVLLSKVTGSETTLGSWIYDITHSGEASDQAAGKVAQLGEAAGKLGQDAGASAAGLQKQAAAAGEAADQGDKLAGAAENEQNWMEKLGISIDPVAEATKRLAIERQMNVDATGQAEAAERGYTVELVNGVPTYKQYGDALSKVTDTKKTAADATDKLSDREKLAIANAHDMEKTLLDLASNERIKAMEFKVNLDVEGLKAQVAQVEAAFEQIGNFYESNATIIGQLTEGFMAGATDADREFFKEQIARQMDMEQQVVDSQVALNASITEMNRAYAQSLTQETLVRIESDGLDASIETFMFEVLKRIQTKVVGDRAAFLLGAGA